VRIRAILLLAAAFGCRERPLPQRAEPDAAAQSCLDQELSRRGLNPYGDPPDTMYAGGTPLFDEKTGRALDRTAYVYARHPEIARSCDAGG
jgi:hypothetical protein